MLARAIALSSLLAFAIPAHAQEGPAVLALAPTDASPDWPAGLAIELAFVGGQVLHAPLVAGPAVARPVLSARVAAQVAGAEAAIWLSDDRTTVHVALAAAERSFEAPLADSSDGRTIALVAASLLEEAFATAEATGTPLPESPPRDQLTTPIEPVRQLSDAERPPIHRPLDVTVARPPEVVAYGAIGTGGLAVFSDVALDPGALARALVGVRVGPYFQAQAAAEAGLYRERVGANDGVEMQPFWRVCPEVISRIPVSERVSLQIGAHGCGGTAEVRHYVYGGFDGVFGGVAWAEDSVLMLAAGGFVAVEVGTSATTSIIVRMDVDGSSPVVTTSGVSVSRQPDAIASLSTMVGFR